MGKNISIKGRFHPFKNQYYLYSGSPDSPELQRRLHQTFNEPNTPYQDHLASINKLAGPGYYILWEGKVVPASNYYGYYGSWVYDVTDGSIYTGHNHVDILPLISDWEEKMKDNQFICGWYGQGYSSEGYLPIAARIATDTVSGNLADKQSPLAQIAIKAAIEDYNNRHPEGI
jgi:hypothetical protein